MPDHAPHELHSWRAASKTPTGRDTWRLLRWKMTEAEAKKWATTNNTRVEKVAGSLELRPVGGYVGWGQETHYGRDSE